MGIDELLHPINFVDVISYPCPKFHTELAKLIKSQKFMITCLNINPGGPHGEHVFIIGFECACINITKQKWGFSFQTPAKPSGGDYTAVVLYDMTARVNSSE